MFIIIRFDNAAHKTNEQTETWGPYGTADIALAYASSNFKFYAIARMKQSSSSLRIQTAA